MMLTHRFGSATTLHRALYWLGRHGFEVSQTDAKEHDTARLTMNLDLAQASAAFALIDSIERSDPEGWPGLRDQVKPLHVQAVVLADQPPTTGSSTPIHWQGPEDHSTSDLHSHKVREYMFSRWE